MKMLTVNANYQSGTLGFDLKFQTSAQFTAIEGPSGAGKSTFLRIIAGIARPKHAVITFGKTIWQDHATFIPAWQRHCGWVPQDALLFPHLSVRANLTFAEPDAAKNLKDVTEALGISLLLERFPRNLSGGERQRVALGRALLSSSSLLLLDEPFAALDRRLRERVRSFVHQWTKGRGTGVILVTHQPQDAQDWNAEHWILEQGRIERL